MINSRIEKKEKIIEEREILHEERICDICGNKIENYEINNQNYKYEGRNIEYYELDNNQNIPQIGMITETYNYGDIMGTHGECFDVCKECYEAKVKPLLKKELNIEPREVEYDW